MPHPLCASPPFKIYIPLLLRCERRTLSKACRVPLWPSLLTTPAHPHMHHFPSPIMSTSSHSSGKLLSSAIQPLAPPCTLIRAGPHPTPTPVLTLPDGLSCLQTCLWRHTLTPVVTFSDLTEQGKSGPETSCSHIIPQSPKSLTT